MLSMKVRPSTIQIMGTLISIFVGVIVGYLIHGPSVSPGIAAASGLALALLGEILTFSIDIYYGALGEGRGLQEAMKASPVLLLYEDCINAYAQLKSEFDSRGEIGRLLSDWLDEKVRLHFREADADWKNGKLRFQQDQHAIRSVQTQKCVQFGGFATQLERSTSFWETAQEYLEDTRSLARDGKKITRVFLLNSPDSLRNEALVRQISKDLDSGIITLVVYLDSLNIDAIREFAVYDERLVAIVELTPVGARVTGCTYSLRQEDVKRANGWKDEILRHAEHPPSLPAVT
jgi:hypothetical protein